MAEERQADSFKKMALFGVDQTNGNIYWDGKLIETTKRLATFERWLAGVGAGSELVLAVIEVIRVAREQIDRSVS